MARKDLLRISNLRVTWGIIYLFLFAYRTCFSIIGESVVRKLTSIGDTGTYQSGYVGLGLLKSQENYREDFFHAIMDLHGDGFSTLFTIHLGGFFNRLFYGNPYLINIAFQSITFIALVYLLQTVSTTVRLRLLLLLMLPSFTLWTSIASKECIVAATVAVLAAYFIRLYSGRIIPGVHDVLAAAILFAFKPHYGLAFLYGIGTTLICQLTRRKALTALSIGLASLSLLVIFREQIVRYSGLVQDAFFVDFSIGAMTLGGARSTRSDAFFVEDADVFLKAPEGFVRAFFGPTITEMTSTILHTFIFIEGVILFAIIIYFIIKVFLRLPVYNAIVATFMTFWLMFPNYPFGVMNSGAAIRYRSGWIILLLVLVAVFLSRSLYINWTSRITHVRSGTL